MSVSLLVRGAPGAPLRRDGWNPVANTLTSTQAEACSNARALGAGGERDGCLEDPIFPNLAAF